jgi:hypothetical protein
VAVTEIVLHSLIVLVLLEVWDQKFVQMSKIRVFLGKEEYRMIDRQRMFRGHFRIATTKPWTLLIVVTKSMSAR